MFNKCNQKPHHKLINYCINLHLTTKQGKHLLSVFNILTGHVSYGTWQFQYVIRQIIF